MEQHSHITCWPGMLHVRVSVCMFNTHSMGNVKTATKCVVNRDFFLFLPQAMSSPEDKAYEIMRELDVSYVLVIFGGLTGYASDGGYYLELP